MTYELNFGLQQRAGVKIAILFWTKQEVKDRIVQFFQNNDQFYTNEVKDRWREFTKNVMNEFYDEKLPQLLEAEVMHLVKIIGENLFDMYQFIKYEDQPSFEVENISLNYIDKLHWTSYGNIDGAKTLKTFWLDNPNLSATKVYDIACSYAVEEHIDQLWHKIPNDIQNNNYEDIFNRLNRHILAYWKCRRDNTLPNLIKYFESAAGDSEEHLAELSFMYDQNLTPEVNMLKLSVHEGYSTATKYFWSKIPEEHRNINLLEFACKTVENYNYYEKMNHTIKDYMRGQYVEICMFLISQMTANDKQLFFTTKIRSYGVYNVELLDPRNEILKMLLSSWPWQELFVSVLKDVVKFQNYDNTMVCTFMDVITNKLVEEYELGYSTETSKYRTLLYQAWRIIPEFTKQNMLGEDVNYKFVCDLINVWDINSLKLILNDPAIAAIRNEFIELGSESYERLIAEDQFEKLDEFMEEIFKSTIEKKFFKQTINVWHLLINNNQFQIADKLLNWQDVTPEEEDSIKNNIDHISLCKDLIERQQYDAANNLLIWKFKTEEERKKCRDHFKSDIFSIERIYKIWKRHKLNIQQSTWESLQFLSWFLESEREIVRFKKEKIIHSEMNDFFMDYLCEMNAVGIIDYFINWCSVSKKVGRTTKKSVLRLQRDSDWFTDDM
ncbi:uncharacterized protein [Chelonus insularis]|uniref:uncharacterized protein n=1 Tax=Chelonus insularis TaxID=460826 RepID=UPI00158DA0B5|nr:uncharacterized protein LOC118075108 [Chelonus insularis]